MPEDLKQNIERLIALYEAEKKRADTLEGELSEERQAVRILREQIVELNRQIDNMKLSQAFMAGGDNRLAKERLEKLIGEIDKCIRQLEK
ncbi:MAG: hypothetical protein IJS62_04880 [Bacteroidales bacterium]|nr:hypothetical protein [Bacteroidales bacterium]